MRKWIYLLLTFLVLAGCTVHPATITSTPAPVTTSLTASIQGAADATLSASKSYPWWNNSVFYEIIVRSFYDSNGDGIGDFNGITEKLDYLNDGNPVTTNDLGITGIWLMPIFPSPSYHGYDVTDYYAVNPEYGTMGDFKRLLLEADKRGIQIIIDLVLNHTSEQHPWFKSAVSDRNSPHRDWYIWSDVNPKYAGPWGENVWHPSPIGYYYGLFVDFMPDLNYNNPSVSKEMEKITAFWLRDVGVDGFRLDAAKHLIEDGMKQENTAATHEWFKQYRPFYKGINPNSITIGEISGGDQGVMASYTQGDQLDLTFDFGQASAILQTASSGNALNIKGAMKLTYKLVPDLQYATFITNHDQNRAMNELAGDIDKAKVAATLLLTSPGVPFIYYGEEIGMVGEKPDEDIRRPMQWTADMNAGFTTGQPWRAPDTSYSEVNVATQGNDPNSLLSLYRNLISLRNQHSALQTGSLVMLDADNSNLYAHLRANETEMILVVVNLSDTAISNYNLTLRDAVITPGAYSLSPLFGEGSFTRLQVDPDGKFKDFKLLAELPPYGKYILELTAAK